VLFLLPGEILVLEFKGYDDIKDAEKHQASLYVRDLTEYHSAVKYDLNVRGSIVYSTNINSDIKPDHEYQVYLTSSSRLSELINKFNHDGDCLTPKEFLQEVYQPSSTSDKLKVINSPRDLPKLTDILNFKDCIETYSKELISSEVNNKIELVIFYPLILWWELTTIIPMRPSEFCMIKRDCLSNDKISFPRFKQKRKKAKSREAIVYDTLPIPKCLADKIKHYIRLTAEFGHSEYLISLPAYLEFTLINQKSNVDYTTKHFTNEYLRKLINRFYQEIVIDKYSLSNLSVL